MRKVIKAILFFIPHNIIDITMFEMMSFIGRLFSAKLKLDKIKSKTTKVSSRARAIVVSSLNN